jgi:hypothetical protein
MFGIETMRASDHARNHFADVSKMVRTGTRPNGAQPCSPGQRPGNGQPTYFPSPNGAKPNTRRTGRVTPRWGLENFVASLTRGDAPGYRVIAPLAREMIRPNGAKPDSPGQRPGTTPPPHQPSPSGAKPNPEAHK